jgi:hypothetical protein
MPPHPPRRGSLFIVPQAIRPQLVRTGIEVCCYLFLNDFYEDIFVDSFVGYSKYENIHVIRCGMSTSRI